MTKEELEQKAIENVRNRFSICKNRNDDFILDNFGAEVEALVQFAEPIEKRIEELEAENEQIKNSDTLCKLIGEQKRKITELEAQIEKMKEVILDLLWFEDNLDPYMYECNDAQNGELLKPFDKARFYLEKYRCKKCKGEGTIKVGYNGWTTNPCPACEGKGYILRR